MFKRSGSVTRYTVIGSVPPITNEAFTEALSTHRFRSIESAASEEVSFGWVTAEDPSGNSFDIEDLDFEVAVWLRFRIDKKKLPATWLRIHRAIAQKAAGRPLTAKEKREVKEELEEKLLPNVLPTVLLIDAAWFPKDKSALLMSTSTNAREVFDKLFRETFGVELEPQNPRTLAESVGLSAEQSRFLNEVRPVQWMQDGAPKDLRSPSGPSKSSGPIQRDTTPAADPTPALERGIEAAESLDAPWDEDPPSVTAEAPSVVDQSPETENTHSETNGGFEG